MKISAGAFSLLTSLLVSAAVLYVTLYNTGPQYTSSNEATYIVDTHKRGIKEHSQSFQLEDTQSKSTAIPTCQEGQALPDQSTRQQQQLGSQVFKNISKQMYGAL